MDGSAWRSLIDTVGVERVQKRRRDGRTPDVRDRAPVLAPAILEVRVSHRDTLEDVSQSEDLRPTRDRKLLILNGEMLERSIRHAWKANSVEQHRATPRHVNVYAIRELASKTISRCASVNLDVLRGSKPDVSHSYHNRCCIYGNAERTKEAGAL